MEITLEDVRPPDEKIVHERDEDGEPVSWTYSKQKQDEDNDWGIVHMRVLESDSPSIEFLEFLEPTFEEMAVANEEIGDIAFDTWDDAEEYIQNEYEQPDASNEVICPRHIGEIQMDIVKIKLQGEDGRVLYSGPIPEKYKN